MRRIFKIKKCYNCTSEPILTHRVLATGRIEYKIICENCGLEQFGYFSRKIQAINAWNKQTNPSPFWNAPYEIETNLIKINNMRNKHGKK